MAKDYQSTLNLPKTAFEMRANLQTREPKMLDYWHGMDLYHKMLTKQTGKPAFRLHDGPPFSNGNIHMGTAMNKILKDVINKSKAMSGYYVPFIPGWDNHGMPIESAIIKQNKLDRKKMSVPDFRRACHEFAMKYVCVQREDFKRLGVNADWEKPYLTMDPAFEAREMQVFGEMYKRGYIYKGYKPVYWCPKDETALAEAEIEYQTDSCTSVYVKFRVKDDGGKLAGVCDRENTYFIIWTTTTWTLPGNLAIALNPTDDYVVVKADNGECYIVADALCAKTMEAGGIANYEVLTRKPGKDFEYMKAQHPFIDRESLVVNADYVTMETGTGCVHTAPGFGADDYQTCKRYHMEIIVPVDDRGYQTEDAGKFAGVYYADSNAAILEEMKASGALFASREFEHEYPHCWRCKNPIIFRATPQWFCSVDAFKDAACTACAGVEWLPAWGGDRMVQMIRERADWCISRQRKWGLPIPVFYCDGCKEPICTDETIAHISSLFAREGSNVWFEKEEAELLPPGFRCPKCNGVHFTKEQNTLDGWFDSGSSHFSVIEDEKTGPADMYLEGADQYRGWFQSSLLTTVGAGGKAQAPFKTVLTHGWTVDGEGKAMHKSLGNVISPLQMIEKYGADLVRLWVASSDYRVDVRVSDPIFKQLSETYRKFRNTARIMLANLTDFNPDTDMVPVSQFTEIDKWIVSGMNDLVAMARNAYQTYEFHLVYHGINNFCTTNLSKLYIDITKDRLYTEKADGIERRSAQSALYLTLSALVRLYAPILSFTAEEIWQFMPHLADDCRESVFLNAMPAYSEAYHFPEIKAHWDALFSMRDDVMKALEAARTQKMIGKSLDAALVIYTKDEGQYATLSAFAEKLSTVFIVSSAGAVLGEAPAGAFADTTSGIAVSVTPAQGEKCDRCWTYTANAYHDGEGCLCARCKKIVIG